MKIASMTLPLAVIRTALAMALAFLGLMALAQPSPPQLVGNASGVLDGMVFAGLIGPRGDPDVNDELHFQDGQFWSSGCVRCGFKPGAYFVRRVGAGWQFRGELAGEGGRFFYNGIVLDGQLRTEIRWVKERWYRTVERDLEFVGTMSPARMAPPADDALAVALGAQPGDQCPR